jgi:hypothetical protein
VTRAGFRPAAIASVLSFPEGFPAVHRGARRVLLERFPYGLHYRTVGQRVIIVACLHAAPDPPCGVRGLTAESERVCRSLRVRG